jgi:glycosyltransferase involved in cell wall biosynthesis
MQLLMIGFDHTILAEGPARPGDARERHIKYAETLRQYYPGGHITVVLRVPPSWSHQEVELGEGLTIYPVPSRRGAFVIRAIVVLKELFRNRHFDVVTTQTPFDDGWIGMWLKRKFGIPLNVQMRSSFLDLPYWIRERPLVYHLFNLLGKWVAHQADTVRVVSDGEKHRLEQRFRKLNGKIVSLHPLVNTQIFDQPVGDEDLAQVHETLTGRGIDGAPFLLFVGRLVIQKNLPTLFEAFATVNKAMPKTVLVIAGDGPLRGRLQRFAKELGTEDRIVWLGNLPLQSLRAWYAAARATVFPSFHEGFGKVVVESYLTGTPVIATPFISAQELIREGETGFIAPEFTNHQWLADRTLDLLSNPERAKEMGRRGKKHVQNYLLPEHQYLERLIDIWRQTAEKSHSGKTEVNL